MGLLHMGLAKGPIMAVPLDMTKLLTPPPHPLRFLDFGCCWHLIVSVGPCSDASFVHGQWQMEVQAK
jgi:hypothetical protein